MQHRGVKNGAMEVILAGFLHFLEHLSYVQYSSFQLSSTDEKVSSFIKYCHRHIMETWNWLTLYITSALHIDRLICAHKMTWTQLHEG